MQLAGLDALQSLADLEQEVSEIGDWSETNDEKLKELRHYLESLADTASYFRIKPEYDDPDVSPRITNN